MEDIEVLKTRLRQLADDNWAALDDEHRDRQILLETMIDDVRRIVGPAPSRATVTLFKESGKYYTEEEWAIPDGAIVPADMERSSDFRRIGGGAVLIGAQEPWGYPHLFPAS
jgi:hypothetical protein